MTKLGQSFKPVPLGGRAGDGRGGGVAAGPRQPRAISAGKTPPASRRSGGRRAEPEFRADAPAVRHGHDVDRAGEPVDDRPDRRALRGLRGGAKRGGLDSGGPFLAGRAQLHQFLRTDPNAADQVFPLDPESAVRSDRRRRDLSGEPGSPKYQKIASAAVLACAAISPSRDLGFSVPGNVPNSGPALKSAYATLAPSSQSNAAVPGRLDHKLAYAWNNTTVEVRFFHKNQEPPLVPYPDVPPFCLATASISTRTNSAGRTRSP